MTKRAQTNKFKTMESILYFEALMDVRSSAGVLDDGCVASDIRTCAVCQTGMVAWIVSKILREGLQK